MGWMNLWRRGYAPWTVALLLVVLVGCGPGREEAGAQNVAATPAPAAPAAAPATETENGTVAIEFWTTDDQPERIAAYEAVAQRFMQAHPNVDLRIVAKDEASVSTDLEAAAAENRLPALVRIGVERLAGMSQAGWLDEQAASAVIRTINLDDFRAGPLEMVTNLESQQQWAIPFDGWLQAIWYRKDLFDASSLPAPATWDQINQACDAFMPGAEPAVAPSGAQTTTATGALTITASGAQSNTVQFALALPSDPSQNYGHQVFEQIALSNQAWPLAPTGEVTFTSPEMIEALRFYTALQRCSAPAPISAQQAADHYLRGEVAMLFYSTYIMDDLVEGASREDGTVVMPTLPDLAQRTSFASGMVGPRASAVYGQVVALAILQGADPLATDPATKELIQEAAKFFLTDGYVEILATAPLGKVPTRQSVADRWTELSPIFENYSPATLGHIANGFDSVHRWALRGEYSNAQRAIISEIETRLLIPQAIDKILRGEMTPESAAQWLQEQTQALVGG